MVPAGHETFMGGQMGVSTASAGALPGRGRRFSRSVSSFFAYGGRYSAPAAYLLAALIIAIGWLGRDTRNLHADEGLGYLLGIIGGVAMLVIPLYSVRKRIRNLQWLGPIRHWFRAHMGLGIVGPLLILFHSNFQLGDLNSRIALYCALLVAGSGIIGRYLYMHIHMGLYGRRATLADRTQRLRESVERASSGMFKPVYERLASLDREILKDAESLSAAAFRPVVYAFKTRLTAWQLDRPGSSTGRSPRTSTKRRAGHPPWLSNARAWKRQPRSTSATTSGTCGPSPSSAFTSARSTCGTSSTCRSFSCWSFRQSCTSLPFTFTSHGRVSRATFSCQRRFSGEAWARRLSSLPWASPPMPTPWRSRSS